MSMSISVVVPTFRRPQLLQQCLQALSRQDINHQDFEIIIVSDGPDPVTDQVVAASRNVISIRCLQLPAHKGPAAARNAGWRASRGELIAFTDDDCIPASGWLSAIWNCYNLSKGIAFTGKIFVPVPERPTDFEKNTQGLESAAFVTANCAIKKTMLETVGGFDENFSMAWREDSDMEFKLLQHGVEIVSVNNALVTHPVRKADWGVSIVEQKKGMFDALLYKKFPELFRQKIRTASPWSYYAIILFFAGMITGIVLGYDWLSFACAAGWLGLTGQLISRRLAGTSNSFNHVIEMIVTSFIIPFFSIYWQFYGAVKYRVLFI